MPGYCPFAFRLEKVYKAISVALRTRVRLAGRVQGTQSVGYSTEDTLSYYSSREVLSVMQGHKDNAAVQRKPRGSLSPIWVHTFTLVPN